MFDLVNHIKVIFTFDFMVVLHGLLNRTERIGTHRKMDYCSKRITVIILVIMMINLSSVRGDFKWRSSWRDTPCKD